MGTIYRKGVYYGSSHGGEGGDGSSNADWNAKEGEAGYIANKPFYEEKSDAFTDIVFDGTIDSDNLIGGRFYKISDTVIDENIVQECKFYLKVAQDGYEDLLIEAHAAGAPNSSGQGDYYIELFSDTYGIDSFLFCIANDVPDDQGTGFSKGLFGVYSEYGEYIYKIEPPAHIQTIDEKFLPESAISYRTVTVPEPIAAGGLAVDYILTQDASLHTETVILGSDLNIGSLTIESGSKVDILNPTGYSFYKMLLVRDVENDENYGILGKNMSDLIRDNCSRILTADEFKRYVSGWFYGEEDTCNNIVIPFRGGMPFIETSNRFVLSCLFYILTDFFGYRNVMCSYSEEDAVQDRYNEIVDSQLAYIDVWNSNEPFLLYNIDARKKYVATKTKEEYENEVIAAYSEKLGVDIEELGLFDYLLPTVNDGSGDGEFYDYTDSLKAYEVAYIESTETYPNYYHAESNNLPFRFGIDEDGSYGYIKNGEESITPFGSGDGGSSGGGSSSGVKVLRKPRYPEKMFDVIDEMAAKVAEERGYYNPVSQDYEYGYFKFSDYYYPNTTYSYNGGENSLHWADSGLALSNTVFKVTEIAYNGNNPARKVTFTDNQGITHIFHSGNHYNTDAVRLAGAPLPGMNSEDDVAPEAIHFTVTGGKLYLMCSSRADLIFALVQSTTSIESFAKSTEYYSDGSGYVTTTHCTGAYAEQLDDNNELVISGDFDCRLYCTYSNLTEITAIEIVDIGHNRTYRYEDVNGNFAGSFFEEDGWYYANKFEVVSDDVSAQINNSLEVVVVGKLDNNSTTQTFELPEKYKKSYMTDWCVNHHSEGLLKDTTGISAVSKSVNSTRVTVTRPSKLNYADEEIVVILVMPIE